MEGGFVQHRLHGGNGKVIEKRKVKRRSASAPSSSSSSSSSSTVMKKMSSCLKDGSVRREIPVKLGLQRLYSCCREVFKGAGFVPSQEDTQTICNILDRMTPEDLGLSQELQFFKPGRGVNKSPRVTCTTVYECPKKNFSMVLFFLPASAVIPLHNHPEMTVFSKLLLGTMHIKAYDWVDTVNFQVKHCDPPSSLRLARQKTNNMFTAPCNTTVIYPTSGGNIHAFTAITPCAVLDVIGPPYSKEDGRDCTYYKDFLYRSPDGQLEELKDEEQSYAWLKEVELPEESTMDCIAYLGPRINDTAS